MKEAPPMVELELLGANGDTIVMTDEDGERYSIVVDDALRAAVRRDRGAILPPSGTVAEMGRPDSCPRPRGTDMPPFPAMLFEIVNISEAYIWVGSLISPKRKAVRGVAGMRMTSHCS